ncbi:MAG: SAM-dependent methyltransferase [Burkholderiales bacterium]
MSPITDAHCGRLVLVPTPLDFGVATGVAHCDLQDTLPLGVIRQAAALTHWIAESAKTARAFLKRVDAVVPLAQPLQSLSIIELPRPVKGARAAIAPDFDALLAPAIAGHDVGLVSEAGLAAVADPGAAVVQAAHRLGITVVALPGASSLVLALAASGLNGQSFAFVGYVPVEDAARAARIRELEVLSRRAAQAQLMIETPYRNMALLTALLAHLQPTTRLAVSCGLTLPTGWNRSDSIAAWRASTTTLPADVPAVFALQAG